MIYLFKHRIVKQIDKYRPYYIIQKRFLFIWWTYALDDIRPCIPLKFKYKSEAEHYLIKKIMKKTINQKDNIPF